MLLKLAFVCAGKYASFFFQLLLFFSLESRVSERFSFESVMDRNFKWDLPIFFPFVKKMFNCPKFFFNLLSFVAVCRCFRCRDRRGKEGFINGFRSRKSVTSLEENDATHERIYFHLMVENEDHRLYWWG